MCNFWDCSFYAYMIFIATLEDERLMNTGIRDFVTELKNVEGCRVGIKITHKLYGKQKIETNFKIIDDASRLGFRINRQDIYIDKEEIVSFGIMGDIYYFASDLMHIELKTI